MDKLSQFRPGEKPAGQGLRDRPLHARKGGRGLARAVANRRDLYETSRYPCRDWEELAEKCAELDLDLVHNHSADKDFWLRSRARLRRRAAPGER
ncbi:hypothetical protein [Bradyrhizobium guangzhouense]|uniref:hypothetical protein n=1 Tax=Bradyrhizobium guangzhouense TaxID=1325095 RepID=UPI0010090362|nr:hypothetical protein [Bradyrhizobium guangzhouense]